MNPRGVSEHQSGSPGCLLGKHSSEARPRLLSNTNHRKKPKHENTEKVESSDSTSIPDTFAGGILERNRPGQSQDYP